MSCAFAATSVGTGAVATIGGGFIRAGGDGGVSAATAAFCVEAIAAVIGLRSGLLLARSAGMRNCLASLGNGGAGTSSSRLTSDPHAVMSEHVARYKVAFVVNEVLTFISLSI